MSNQYPPPDPEQEPYEQSGQPLQSGPSGQGPASSNSRLAIASVALGITGLLGVFVCGLGALLGIGAIITGWMGLREIGASQASRTGRGMAIAGIVTGAISVVLLIVIIFVVTSGSEGPFYREPSY